MTRVPAALALVFVTGATLIGCSASSSSQSPSTSLGVPKNVYGCRIAQNLAEGGVARAREEIDAGRYDVATTILIGQANALAICLSLAENTYQIVRAETNEVVMAMDDAVLQLRIGNVETAISDLDQADRSLTVSDIGLF